MRHHLAVLCATYLQLIREGTKTVECRLSRHAEPPYGVVESGDLLWLKEASGPVRAVAEVGKVQLIESVDRAALRRIRRQLDDRIQAEPAFWRIKHRAAYCTLIWLRDVQSVTPFRIVKTDSRAWVMLDGPLSPDQAIAPAEQPST